MTFANTVLNSGNFVFGATIGAAFTGVIAVMKVIMELIRKPTMIEEPLQYSEGVSDSVEHNNITWERLETKITVDDIKHVESETGLKLPKDYVECVLKYNGGKPEPYITKDEEYEFRELYSLNQKDSLNAIDRFHTMYSENSDIPRNFQGLVFPFASDSFGNDLCFKYKTKEDTEPTIIFVDHETLEDEYVASTFTELLNMLTKTSADIKENISESPQHKYSANPTRAALEIIAERSKLKEKKESKKPFNYMTADVRQALQNAKKAFEKD